MRLAKVAITVFALLVSFGTLSHADELLDEARDNFSPLPDAPIFKENNPGTAEVIKLGKMLYFEPRLSKSGVFSCNSCHNLATGGVDNTSFSTGHQWQVGGRNAPTVLNASLHITQFWDGRAPDVEAQAQGPVLAGVEMASTKKLVLDRLKSIPTYTKLFTKAYGFGGLTYENMANAIGAFERTLLTPSRFDEYLKGNTKALTAAEKKGLSIFMDKGCVACHRGITVGGRGYQKFGLEHEPENFNDVGRFAVTQKEDDRGVFKIPSLRNIRLTYPYFHDGSVWELEEVVRIMAWVQLDEKLSDGEVTSIVTFLDALTGKQPMVVLPTLPPSTKTTPKPDRD